MTTGTEPLKFVVALPRGAVRMCAEKATRHSQRDRVGTEEKCEYEAFVTDPCTCGFGIAKIASDVEKEKSCLYRLCRKLRSAGSPLNQQSRMDAVGEGEINEHQAFVTTLCPQAESVTLPQIEMSRRLDCRKDRFRVLVHRRFRRPIPIAAVHVRPINVRCLSGAKLRGTRAPHRHWLDWPASIRVIDHPTSERNLPPHVS